MEPEQPIRDLVALLDQARAALTDVALLLADYRRQLIDAGFDRDDALELCVELQRAIIFIDAVRE